MAYIIKALWYKYRLNDIIDIKLYLYFDPYDIYGPYHVAYIIWQEFMFNHSITKRAAWWHDMFIMGICDVL